MYFTGYTLGIMFFFLPDAFGRKKAMLYLLPIVITAMTLIVFGEDMETKGIGYLLSGLMHMRITSCYAHCIELLPEAYKSSATTMINIIDQSTIFFTPLYLSFVDNNL